MGFAKLYDRKTPVMAADLLNDRGGALLRAAGDSREPRADRPRDRVVRRTRAP